MLGEDNLLKNTGLTQDGARTGTRVGRWPEAGPITNTLVILKQERWASLQRICIFIKHPWESLMYTEA